jgi:predicted nucleic acid-binding protein
LALILADTNILLRSLDLKHPQCLIADEALLRLNGSGNQLCISPQNIIEFWTVATRPVGYNGLGMTAAQASADILTLQQYFSILPYKPETFGIWQTLVMKYQVIGKQAHDAHLVAFMQAHGIDKILTFNAADFNRFPNITAIDPAMA